MGRGTGIGSIYRSAFSGVLLACVYLGTRASRASGLAQLVSGTLWIELGPDCMAIRLFGCYPGRTTSSGGELWRLGIAVYEDATTAKTKASGLNLKVEACNRVVSNMTCAKIPSRKIRF